MSYYAHFVRAAGGTFRVDTRIYLKDSGKPGPDDLCIAAIVAKNPGSASATRFGTLAPLQLNGDKMLPTVRNHFIAAFEEADKPIPKSAFVRVWNLFYLCDAKLSQAIRRYSLFTSPPLCQTEGSCPPIVWFAWRGSHRRLNVMKSRFATLPGATLFFYDWRKGSIVEGIPMDDDCAKHPQGLGRDKIWPFLAPHI